MDSWQNNPGWLWLDSKRTGPARSPLPVVDAEELRRLVSEALDGDVIEVTDLSSQNFVAVPGSLCPPIGLRESFESPIPPSTSRQ